MAHKPDPIPEEDDAIRAAQALLEDPNIDQRILKEGFLKKQGGARGGFRTWKQRWFLLRADYLSYYRSRSERREEKGQLSVLGDSLLGVLPLHNAKIIDLEEDIETLSGNQDDEPSVSASTALSHERSGDNKGGTKDREKCTTCRKELNVWRSRVKCAICDQSYCNSCTVPSKTTPKSPKQGKVCIPCSEKSNPDKRLTPNAGTKKNVKKGTPMDRYDAKPPAAGISVANAPPTKSPNQRQTVEKKTEMKSKSPRKEEEDVLESVVKKVASQRSSIFEFGRKKHMFAIKNMERVLWLSAETEKEKQEWIQILKRVIDAYRLRVKNNKAGPDFQNPQWEVDYGSVEMSEKIGDGAFGEVYKGRLWGTEVAVKKFKAEEINQKVLTDLKKEVAILSQLRHPNVVLYIGACTKPPNVCIVTEWCDRGSLNDVLHDPSIVLDTRTIIQIAIGIAQGMNYLHSLERKIIHRDLKSHNILMDKSFNVKVADFGLSHVRSHVRNRRQKTKQGGNLDLPAMSVGGHYGVYGTPEWMAPEVMEGVVYNQKVDVYSFGIVLCELFTRKLPFRDKINIRGYMDIVDAVLDEGLIPTIPKWCGKQLRNLIELCLSRHVPARPSFMNIITKLRSLFPSNYNNYFLDYDVPRLREMLMSKDKKTQLMAAREIADMDKEKVLNCGRCGYIPSYSDIPDGDMEVFISRLSSLISSSSTQIVLSSTKAILALLKVISKPKFPLYKELISQQNGFERILALASSNNVVVCESAFTLLNFLTSYNHYGLQIAFDGLEVKSLEKLKEVILVEMAELERKKDEIEKILSQKRDVLLRIAKESQDPERSSEKVIPTDEEKTPVQISKARDPVRNSPPFPAPVISAIEPVDVLTPPFVEHCQTECKADISVVVHCKAWRLDNESQHWNPVYLLFVGGLLKIYQTQKDHPGNPVSIIYCITTSNSPIAVQLCRKHGKPHCVYLFDGDFDTWLCFRSQDDAKKLACAIDPKISTPDASHPFWKKSSLETKDVEAFAASLPEQALVSQKLLGKNMSVYHENSVLHCSYMLLMDPQTGIWGPFFFMLLKTGIIKVYETHETDPEHPSGILYVRSNQSPAIRLILPEVQSVVDPELQSVASTWGNIGLIMEIDVADYDMCCRTKEERDKWIKLFRDDFQCEISSTPVVVTKTDVLLEAPTDPEVVRLMEEKEALLDEHNIQTVDLDYQKTGIFASPSEVSSSIVTIDEFTFGFPIDDAPELSLIPHFTSANLMSQDIQPAYVLLKASVSDLWEPQIAVFEASSETILIFDQSAGEGSHIFTTSPMMRLATKSLRLGRRFGKPYCVFNKDFAMCFKSALIAVKWFKGMSPATKLLPPSISSQLAKNSRSAPVPLKELLDQATRLPKIKALSDPFVEAFGDQCVKFSYVLLRDEQVEVWSPFFMVLLETAPKVREIRFFYSHEDKLASPVFIISASKIIEESPDMNSLAACSAFPEPGVTDAEWNAQVLPILSDAQKWYLLLPPQEIEDWYTLLFRQYASKNNAAQ